MIEPTPEERQDIALAMSHLRRGPTSELQIQNLLGLKPTTARRFCDDLVSLGVAFRHNRELHLNVVELRAEPDLSLVPRLHEKLTRVPGTARSLAAELEEPLEVVRATLEHMRARDHVSASTCGPLMIYRLA